MRFSIQHIYHLYHFGIVLLPFFNKKANYGCQVEKTSSIKPTLHLKNELNQFSLKH